MSRQKENQCLEEFISVYESEKCLWKIKSPEYHDRRKKEAAYRRLVEVWRQVDAECTKVTVLKKINNLRSSYRKELKKVRKSTRSGSSQEYLYVPKLWYYNLLQFLDEESRQNSRSNLSDDESTGNIEVDSLSPPPPAQTTTPVHPPSKVTTTRHNSDADPPNPAAASTSSELSGSMFFGQHVGLQLQGLEPFQRIVAEKLIGDVIFYGKLGQLTDTSIISLVSSSPRAPEEAVFRHQIKLEPPHMVDIEENPLE